MSSPSVAAIVLSYEDKDLAVQALQSLHRSTWPNIELVLVDNASTDGTAEAVRSVCPDATLLVVEENRGISWGLDQGIRYAVESGHDYLLLLNNDIEVDPEMIAEMVRVAEADSSIGCVGPKTYYHSEPEVLWSAGGVIRFKESVTRERGNGELDRGRFDRTEEVDYVNGCAMLVKRHVMEEVGPWDPIYYISIEDADWCLRMRRAGYRCFYAHRAKLWHMVSRSTGGYTAGRTFHTGRSTAIFVRRYAGPWQWLSFLVVYALSVPVALVREAARGNAAAAWAKFRGVVAGLRLEMTPPPSLEDVPRLAPRTRDAY